MYKRQVLDNGDYVYLPGVRKALLNADDELTAIAVKPDGGVVRFTVSLGAMTDAERQILADGCPVSYTHLDVYKRQIIAMLVVYCLRGVNLLGPTHGLPELIAAAAVVGLHLWKKNTLLSIAAGTALYMVLVQVVFV